jgi:hypothetical protein
VARTRRSLGALDGVIASSGCVHRMHELDWNSRRAFLEGVRSAAWADGSRTPHPELVVAWLHDDQMGLALGRLFAAAGKPCSFFQLFGSAAASPESDTAAIARELGALEPFVYHQVILGFRRDGSRSRWLTNEEIASGMLDAIRSRRRSCVVGSVRPSSERP